jgi:pyridoxamine 5'-phosphate oxidase
VNIAEIRQEYMRSGLVETQAERDPIRQFEHWFQDALSAEVPLPNAMTLSTVTPEGAPSARTVLLKGVEDGAFLFFTNYLSRKGRELERRAAACLLFRWSELERQVRIDGAVEKLSAPVSDAYFASRPLGARWSAWASAQSAVVPDRATLESAMAAARERHGDNPPRPAHWGGYRVIAHEIEFWQGRSDRLHDRLRYRRDGARESGAWTIERLSP